MKIEYTSRLACANELYREQHSKLKPTYRNKTTQQTQFKKIPTIDIPNDSIPQRIKAISCLSKRRDETSGIPGSKLTNQKLPRERKRKQDRPLCTRAGNAGHNATYIGSQYLSLFISPSTTPGFLDNLVRQPPGPALVILSGLILEAYICKTTLF
jgi:hypothetical protein